MLCTLFCSARGQAAVACRSFAFGGVQPPVGSQYFFTGSSVLRVRTGKSPCFFIFWTATRQLPTADERPHLQVLLGKEAGLWLGCSVAAGAARVEQQKGRK